MRIEFGDVQPGSWAEIRDRLMTGFARRAALLEDPGQVGEALVTMIRYQVKAWHVLDDDGRTLPQPADCTENDLEFVPQEIVNRLAKAIMQVAQPQEESVPN